MSSTSLTAFMTKGPHANEAGRHTIACAELPASNNGAHSSCTPVDCDSPHPNQRHSLASYMHALACHPQAPPHPIHHLAPGALSACSRSTAFPGTPATLTRSRAAPLECRPQLGKATHAFQPWRSCLQLGPWRQQRLASQAGAGSRTASQAGAASRRALLAISPVSIQPRLLARRLSRLLESGRRGWGRVARKRNPPSDNASQAKPSPLRRTRSHWSMSCDPRCCCPGPCAARHIRKLALPSTLQNTC